MKSIAEILMIGLLLSACLLEVAGAVGKGEEKGMFGSELMEKIRAGSAPLIVDVRSGWEYRSGHVPGAVHLPFQRMFFNKEIFPVSKDKPIVLYCEHGPRAYIARFALHRAGFENVILMQGHMSQWKQGGLPVEKQATP